MQRRPVGRRGATALGVAAWVLAAAVAGSITWRAVALIDSGASSAGVLDEAQVVARLADVEAASGAAALPTSSASPTADGATASASPTDAASAGPTDGPTASPTADGPTPGATTDPAAPPPAAPATPATTARTWAVTGGTVAASCAGDVISLLYATPWDGWGVEVGSRGPTSIAVELKTSTQETSVTAVCAAGTPSESVTVDDRGGSGGGSGGDDDGGGDDSDD